MASRVNIPFPRGATPNRKGLSMIHFTPSVHPDAPQRHRSALQDRQFKEQKRLSSFQQICSNAHSISKERRVARLSKIRKLAGEVQNIMANGEAISPGREVRDSPEVREVWHKPNGRTMSNISAISHQTMRDESTSFTKEWLQEQNPYTSQSFDARSRLFAHSAQRKREEAAKVMTFGKDSSLMRTPQKSNVSARNVSWMGGHISEMDLNNSSSFHYSRPHSRVMDLLEMGRISNATTNDISINEDKVKYLEEKWRPKDLGDFTRKLRIKLTNELSIADKSYKLVKVQEDIRKQKAEERRAELKMKEEEKKRKQAREASKFLQIGGKE